MKKRMATMPLKFVTLPLNVLIIPQSYGEKSNVSRVILCYGMDKRFHTNMTIEM